VRECDETLAPLTQTALLQWINTTFHTCLTFGWLQTFLQSQSALFVVDAEPIESERADLKDEQLKENAKILATKVQKANVELIMNVDETGLDCKRDTEKLRVVSTRQCPRMYRSVRAESHITLLPTIGITGWTLTHLVIIKTLSTVSELAVRYGFPKSNWAHLTTSSSAYINEKLFRYWVDEILVPGVQARHRLLNLADNASALLILDGCLAHNEELLKDLSKYHIDYHFLVPHSSHITQPLDRGIFSFFKRVFKNVSCDDTTNKVGRRMMRGLIALTQVCTPPSIRSSFWRAGMEMNYEDGKPIVTVNVETWLVQRNSPQSDLKEETFINDNLKKRSRTKTAMKGMTKKEEAARVKKAKNSHPEEKERGDETRQEVQAHRQEGENREEKSQEK